jgi:hypothetical protein
MEKSMSDFFHKVDDEAFPEIVAQGLRAVPDSEELRQRHAELETDRIH